MMKNCLFYAHSIDLKYGKEDKVAGIIIIQPEQAASVPLYIGLPAQYLTPCYSFTRASFLHSHPLTYIISHYSSRIIHLVTFSFRF